MHRESPIRIFYCIRGFKYLHACLKTCMACFKVVYLKTGIVVKSPKHVFYSSIDGIYLKLNKKFAPIRAIRLRPYFYRTILSKYGHTD